MFNKIKKFFTKDKFRNATLILTQEEIDKAIRQLSIELCSELMLENITDIKNLRFIPKKIRLVSVLEGGRYFAERLIYHIPEHFYDKVGLNYIQIKTRSSDLEIKEPEINLFGTDLKIKKDEMLIILDDINDSGTTLNVIRQLLLKQNKNLTIAKQTRFITLFSSNSNSLEFKNLQPDKRGIVNQTLFQLDPNKKDQWYVGCGLDLENQHRNQPELRYVIKDDYLSNPKKYLN